MQANSQINEPTFPIGRTFGRVTIVLDRPAAGQTYTVTVTQGESYRLDALCSTDSDLRTAASKASAILTALQGGVSVEQLTVDRQFAQADALAQADRILDEALAGTRTLTDTVPTTGEAQALTHRGGVVATSDPQDVILLAATLNDGIILRSLHAKSSQLIALKKRRLVDLVFTMVGRTRTLTGATLTAKGWAHVERNRAVNV